MFHVIAFGGIISVGKMISKNVMLRYPTTWIYYILPVSNLVHLVVEKDRGCGFNRYLNNFPLFAARYFPTSLQAGRPDILQAFSKHVISLSVGF